MRTEGRKQSKNVIDTRTPAGRAIHYAQDRQREMSSSSEHLLKGQTLDKAEPDMFTTIQNSMNNEDRGTKTKGFTRDLGVKPGKLKKGK